MSHLTKEERERLAAFASAPNLLQADIPGLFFRAALLEHSIPEVPWRTFARAAREALFQMTGDADAWERVAFARDIARRHIGEPALLSWPAGLAWYEALSPNDRLTALAHVVQSAADANLDVLGEYATLAEAALNESLTPTTAEAQKLRGAVGRAHAAIGAYPEAARALEQAVDGWFAMNRVSEASHALSELLRIRGIEGSSEGIDALRLRVSIFLDGTDDAISKAFVHLALGRARIQCGQHDLGRADLAEGATLWKEAPLHAQASRLRWLHFSALAVQDEASAEPLLAALDALREDGQPYDSDQRYLARIDRALAKGTVFAAHMDGLMALTPGGEEAARTIARLAPGVPMKVAMNDRKVVKKMAWEYRY